MNIRLRPTSEADLDFVLEAERAAENSRFVGSWTREQHLEAALSPDFAHLIVETAADKRCVGYVILAGLKNSDESVEFRRIVITEKNKGFGRETLRLVKKMAFEQLNAHRLWLDVMANNARARHIYESEGFVAEGTLRECLKTENSYESLVVMSLLRNEYEQTAT
jgi:RimJ/RimL family protein N-acetyltransferase